MRWKKSRSLRRNWWNISHSLFAAPQTPDLMAFEHRVLAWWNRGRLLAFSHNDNLHPGFRERLLGKRKVSFRAQIHQFTTPNSVALAGGYQSAMVGYNPK
jgi:hypothetical protein